MNLHVSKYGSRVLGVIKEKFDLKDKSEAFDKFTEMFGEEFVEKEIKDKVVLDVIKSCNSHIKKYGYKSMSLKELEKLCGVE